MTLIRRRSGRGGWSTITVIYNAALQPGLPTAVEIRRGQDFHMAGSVYKVSRVLP